MKPDDTEANTHLDDPAPHGWCHASCCSGETPRPSETFNAHDAQLALDQLGMPSGYFGRSHTEVLEAIVGGVQLAKRGSAA